MRKIIKFFALAFVTAILLTSCGSDKNKLREVYDGIVERYPSGNTVLKIASDDSFLKSDTNPYNHKDFYLALYVDICKQTLIELGFNEATWDKMINTRAIDGVRNETRKGILAEWTYHPDKGLETTFTIPEV